MPTGQPRAERAPQVALPANPPTPPIAEAHRARDYDLLPSFSLSFPLHIYLSPHFTMASIIRAMRPLSRSLPSARLAGRRLATGRPVQRYQLQALSLQETPSLTHSFIFAVHMHSLLPLAGGKPTFPP